MSRWLPPLLSTVLFGVGAAGVAQLRAPLAAETHAVRVGNDVVTLPAPRELRVLTLGYKAAAVDVLWGKTLVEYGIHVMEKRAFEVERYLDTILELEPSYLPLYQFVDTLLVYRPPIGTEADARKARAYLERGTRERPNDYRVWLNYGQFIAFLSASFIKDQAEVDAWRRDGALALAHAVELGADADTSLAATTLLSKYGERDAAVRHLERAYQLTDDEETRQQILFKLGRLQAEGAREGLQQASAYLLERHGREAPSVPPAVYGWWGPLVDPARCVGDTTSAECAPTLSEAVRRHEPSSSNPGPERQESP